MYCLTLHSNLHNNFDYHAFNKSQFILNDSQPRTRQGKLWFRNDYIAPEQQTHWKKETHSTLIFSCITYTQNKQENLKTISDGSVHPQYVEGPCRLIFQSNLTTPLECLLG